MSPQTTEMIRLNNTQYSHFLEQADALRHSGSFCDAVVSVESQSFRAHRLVLACASRRLAQQLTPGEAGNISPASSSSSSSSALLLRWTCTLDLLSPRTFQQALDFAYAQTLEVPAEDLGLLLRAAQLLEMRPLEAQCRAQLQALGDAGPADAPETQSGLEEKKEGDGREEEAEEWMEETPHREREKDGRNVLGEEWQRTTSSRREDTHKILPHPTPPLPPPPSDSTPDGSGGRASPSKKRRVSHTPYGRDSVISSPYAAGHFSLPSPWGLSRGGRWTPVAALRRMTSAHFQPHQKMLAYPFPLAAPPHMYPLLASSSFSPQFHGGMADYPAVTAYGQHPLLGGGTPQLGDVAKQGQLRRKPPCQKQLSGATRTREERYHDVHRDTTRRLSDCHHCSPSHLTNTVVQESTSTSADEACGECQPYRRGQRADKPRHCLGKPYQCILCLKRFSLKHQLDTHCRVHTGEKPFECRVCGQRSRDYSAMIKHLRTHGGATPYQCTVCLEFCSSLVAMQRHVKSHPDNDFPPDWSINKTYLYTSHI